MTNGPSILTPEKCSKKSQRAFVAHFIYLDGNLEHVEIFPERAIYTNYKQETFVKSSGLYYQVYRRGAGYEWHHYSKRRGYESFDRPRVIFGKVQTLGGYDD